MPAGLIDELCSALGAALPSDRDGVERLAQAWGAAVSFDPVAKGVAMAEGRRPPGDDPVEVAERWLTTGLGSTCWGHDVVLVALLGAAGVPATVGLDRMITEPAVDFHSFVLVEVDGTRFLIDPIHPSWSLLPFEAGARGDHPVYAVGIDDDDGRLVHWFRSEASWSKGARYAVLGTALDQADVRSFLAVSASHSGVGGRLFLRRTLADRVERFRPSLDGTAIEHTTFAGTDDDLVATITDVDEAIARMGLRSAALDLLVRAGLLHPTSPTPWTV